MKYQITNNSSFKITTLKRVVKFVTHGFGPYIDKPVEIEFRDNWATDELKILKDSNYGGYYFNDKILVMIGGNIKFPFMMESNYSAKRKYIDGLFVRNRIELLVAVLSHEYLHKLQSLHKLPIIASDYIDLDEESQADIFMMVMINKWRRLQDKIKQNKVNKI